MCDRRNGDGSPCTDVPLYQLGFTFEAVGGSKPVEAQSGLKVCEHHRKYANVSDLVDARLIESIQAMLKAAGLMRADPRSFKLTFTPLA